MAAVEVAEKKETTTTETNNVFQIYKDVYKRQAKNRAISWYDLGPISIQPSEFAKVITIVWLARYYEKNKRCV